MKQFILIFVVFVTFLLTGCMFDNAKNFTGSNHMLNDDQNINQNLDNQIQTGTDTKDIGMANPASVYCIQNSGVLEIRIDKSGGQYGVCKFADGSECEEWAFMRGECN